MTDYHSTTPTKAPAVPMAFAVSAGVVVALTGLAYSVRWQSTSQCHSIMETVATCVAAFAGIVALVRHQTRDDDAFLFIGVGFIGTAVLDGYHAVVTADGISQYLPSALPSLIPWSWLASRVLLSLCLYFSWMASRRAGRRPVLPDSVIYFCAGALTLSCILFFAIAPLPRAYYPEFFLHRPAELIPALFFGLALAGYVSNGSWRHDRFERLLICSLIFALATQVFVMTRSNLLFDAKFDLAHLMKIASYLLVVVGLTASVSEAFSKVQRLNVERQQGIAELARANEGLEAFIRSASHDLKAPLRHIFGFCGFVRDDASDRLTANETKDLQRVMDAAAHMSDLLEGLLRFAKLGTTSLRRETFPISEVVDTVVCQLPVQQQAQVEFSELSHATGDKALLTLVIQNLVENGLRYVQDRTPHVVIESESTPTGTHIRVSDNGIGVDQANLTRIFQPGIRGVAESEFVGTGFGLATCARIINAHDGKIWVESTPKQGSTFHVTIPNEIDADSTRNPSRDIHAGA